MKGSAPGHYGGAVNATLARGVEDGLNCDGLTAGEPIDGG